MALTERYVSSSGSGTYAGSTSSGTPMSLSTAFANAVAGDRINVKADGTYTRSASDTLTFAGSNTSPIIYRGYRTTIGDGNLGRTNGNGAIITTNMPLISYNSTFQLTPGSLTILQDLQITGAVSSDNVVSEITTQCYTTHCVITNTGTGGCITKAALGLLFDCDATNSSGTDGVPAVYTSTNNTRIIGCRISGAAAPGVQMATGVLAFCTIFRSGSTAAVIGSTPNISPTIVYNTIVNTGGSSPAIAGTVSTTNNWVVIGNVLTDNATYGYQSSTSSGSVFLACNRFRDNTSGATSGATDWISATNYGVVTSGSGVSDYLNAAGDDYRLITSSPAVEAGLPLYASMGANQLQFLQYGLIF